MKAPFIIFGRPVIRGAEQVSHSLSNILSSSTICVDSSNCPSGGGPGVLLCVEDSFIP